MVGTPRNQHDDESIGDDMVPPVHAGERHPFDSAAGSGRGGDARMQAHLHAVTHDQPVERELQYLGIEQDDPVAGGFGAEGRAVEPTLAQFVEQFGGDAGDGLDRFAALLEQAASLHDIGETIVNPVVGQYDEVLIYVKSGKTTLRRIQWTPQHGYVELVISS